MSNSLFFYLFLLVLSSPVYSAETSTVKLKKEPHNSLVDIELLTKKISGLEKSINKINEHRNILSKESSQYPKGMSFEIFTGLLLACVTLVVTGLGVIVAILALWGYGNIKKHATEAAVKNSEEQLKNAIKSGEFNDVINLAVDKFIYRGIMAEGDFPLDNPEDENEV